MLGYISGEVAYVGNGSVIIDCNGVGYELTVSSYTLKDCVVGEKLRLFSYLQVSEQGVCLYGFATQEEKNMFLLLTSVSGVGCKLAITILSGMDSNTLALAIYGGDIKLLSSVKGLGKKTAERLIVDLKEKVTVDSSQAPLPINTNPDITFNGEMLKAIAVLTSLGKSQQDAEKLVLASSKLGAQTTEELINMSFRIN